MNAHIYIVGMGIANVDDVTRQTERVIRLSNEVLYADTGVASHDYLKSLCGKVTPLFHESYDEDNPRFNAYHHMAARVIEAALRHPPVTFAMHGHPLVFCYPPFLIRDLATLLDLRVEVLPGISAMASLFSDLWLDPGVTGIQMYEATDLMARRRPLMPDVPALIWQIGNLETRLHTMRVSRPERFDRFLAYLLHFYPPEHVVTAVYSSPHPAMKSTIYTFPLNQIGQYAHALHAGFTLFIPAAYERPIQDWDLVHKIDDPQHLRKITYGS